MTSMFGPNRMLVSLSFGVLAFVFVWTISAPLAGQAAPPGHYLFAWAGDRSGKGQDFIAVIDAAPHQRITADWLPRLRPAFAPSRSTILNTGCLRAACSS